MSHGCIFATLFIKINIQYNILLCYVLQVSNLCFCIGDHIFVYWLSAHEMKIMIFNILFRVEWQNWNDMEPFHALSVINCKCTLQLKLWIISLCSHKWQEFKVETNECLTWLTNGVSGSCNTSNPVKTQLFLSTLSVLSAGNAIKTMWVWFCSVCIQSIHLFLLM